MVFLVELVFLFMIMFMLVGLKVVLMLKDLLFFILVKFRFRLLFLFSV